MLLGAQNDLWCECKVTLETEGESSCLIINYQKRSKNKEMKLMILDITCVVRVYDKTRSYCFAINTAVRTLERNCLVLSAFSGKDLNEWLSSLAVACQEARKCQGPPKPSAMWCTSLWGDIFFSDSKDETGILFLKMKYKAAHRGICSSNLQQCSQN